MENIGNMPLQMESVNGASQASHVPFQPWFGSPAGYDPFIGSPASSRAWI